jgi:hypothetical protein
MDKDLALSAFTAEAFEGRVLLGRRPVRGLDPVLAKQLRQGLRLGLAGNRGQPHALVHGASLRAAAGGLFRREEPVPNSPDVQYTLLRARERELAAQTRGV